MENIRNNFPTSRAAQLRASATKKVATLFLSGYLLQIGLLIAVTLALGIERAQHRKDEIDRAANTVFRVYENKIVEAIYIAEINNTTSELATPVLDVMNEKLNAMANGAVFNFRSCSSVNVKYFQLYLGERKLSTCLEVVDYGTGVSSVTKDLLAIAVGLTIFSILYLFLIRRRINLDVLSPLLSSVADLYEREAFAKVAARVVHDIRAPIGALEVTMQNADMTSENLALFKAALHRIKGTINGLLRFKAGDEVSRVLFDPIETTRSVVDLLTAVSKNKKIHLEIDCEDIEENSVLLSGDIISFSDALQNIILNAIESYDNLELKAAVVVRMTLSATDTFVITVSDSGCGVSEANLKRIGTVPFSFGKENGNGIGFISARDYFLNMGATSVRLRKKESGGSDVTIIFSKIRNFDLSNFVAKGNAHILDDDSHFALLASSIFQKNACSLYSNSKTLFSGLERSADSDKLSLSDNILIDFDLGPEHPNGFEVATQLRSLFPSSSFFLMSDRPFTASFAEEFDKIGVTPIQKSALRTYAAKVGRRILKPSFHG